MSGPWDDYAAVADAPSPSVPAPTMGESAVRGARSGATLNWADTLAGLAAASPIPGAGKDGSFNAVDAGAGALRLLLEKVGLGSGGKDAYAKALADQQAQTKTAEETNPGSYLAGELGGAVATSRLTPMIRPFEIAANTGKIATGIKALGNLATTGLLYGAASGAGGAQSGAEVPQAALNSALTGAVMAPAIGTVAGAGGRTLGWLGDHLRATTDPQSAAADLIAARLRRAGANPTDIAARVDAMDAAGVKDYTMADAAGPALGGLPGSIARQPGKGQAPARQFLDQRHFGDDPTVDGQRAALSDNAGDFLGDKGALATGDDIVANRKAAADPLYDAARQDPITMSQDMIDLFPQLKASGAFASARQKMRLAGEDFDLGTLQPWDYMKRALDDKIGIALRKGAKDDARLYGGIKDDLLAELDKQSQNYQDARDVFAGHSELKDALDLGQKVIRPGYKLEQIDRDLTGMSAGERDMYRLGAANALRDKLGGVGGPAGLMSSFKTGGALRQKLEKLAPDPASFDLFKTRVEGQTEMGATRQGAVGGSPTAERLADDSAATDEISHVVEMAHHAASGNKIAFVRSAWRYLKKANPDLRGNVLNEVRKIVLDPNPDTARAFASRMTSMGVPTDKTALIANGAARMSLPAAARGVADSVHTAAAQQPAPVQQADQQQPANSASWRLIRRKSDGAQMLWNPATNEMQPFQAPTQVGGGAP